MPKSSSRRKSGKKAVNNFSSVKRVQVAINTIRDSAKKANHILAMVSGLAATYAATVKEIPDYRETNTEIRDVFNHVIKQIKDVVSMRDNMLKETERLGKIRNVKPEQFDSLLMDADELLRVAVYEIGLHIAPVTERIVEISGDPETSETLNSLGTFLTSITGNQVAIPHNVAPVTAPQPVGVAEAIND